MSNRAYSARRNRFLTDDQLARIESAVLRILDEIGIAVLDDDLLAQAKAAGFRTRGSRVLIDANVVRRRLDAERAANGDRFAEGPTPVDTVNTRLTAFLNEYGQHVHDTTTDRMVTYTTDRLIANTKLADVLAARGLTSAHAGCPTDVAPAIQPVVQYWVGATYARHGRAPVDPKTRATFPYILEMAEALGNPIRHFPVYPISPLTLAGDALECAVAFREHVESIHISTMPTTGSTASIHCGDALAQAAAETAGPAIILQEVLDVPTHWSVLLYPVEFANLAMALGSPDSHIQRLLASETQAYLQGRLWGAASGNTFTRAKMPGAQACSERAALMTAGALLGARSFGPIGTLSLDEAFSAEQLLYDVEIKDYVQKLIEGLDGECNIDRCLADITEAVTSGHGFAGLDTTAARFRDYFQPRLFDYTSISTWLAADQPSVRAQTHAMIEALIAEHDYHLDDDRQKAIDTIVAAAKTKLA